MLTPSIIIALMMKAASTSETLVSFYEPTRRNFPQGCHFYNRRRENLKSHQQSSLIFSHAN
jgi:hypothetical protein